ncbi:MAG TPA: 4-hydroxyphenylpyruvate dioxygenase [Baekduia sp.]|uniref:4-hydroxyphenylpyruvate dioxygenase n=1 Tax=Baekduia sp. TaxID=2600305 RepID=UPI002CF0B061|nr:4-hydroxyphenylpyruvate dioxygenase [Baekduia sp.]HMJ33404.1 4-hydroxyphenylpyruvate dioxygenase [Baekduia sp.]
MPPQTAVQAAATPQATEDYMPLNGIDHVELFVGNAKQAAFFYTRAFGFQLVAYSGLETGARDRASYVLRQGRIRLVLTGALGSDSPIAEHQHKHGDGVKVIALSVPSVDDAWREATLRGAEGVVEPHAISDEHGTVRLATIKTYGETVHTFVERGEYAGAFLPGYTAMSDGSEDTGMLLALDHIVGNVEHMDPWVKYYEDVFDMKEMLHFTDEAISTEYSALMSKVVTSGNGVVKFPINEPAEAKRKSQIDEYLEFYEGPGAQHLAVATRDIVATVAELRRRGVEFLDIPDAYYDEVPARVPEVQDILADLRAQGILVDRDDDGYLLQIFTKPVGDRPTVFFEVIERHGARGFGDGNFKALFEALEREQDRRGNL